MGGWSHVCRWDLTTGALEPGAWLRGTLGLVKEHPEDFLRHAREAYEGPLPKYVEREFRFPLRMRSGWRSTRDLRSEVDAAGEAARGRGWSLLRDTLRDEDGGIDKIIHALKHLASKHPRKTSIATELAYFCKHRKRVEAACKTLVTQRLKQSGMRWSVRGAQAILPPRGWDQSDRFDEGWAIVASTFEVEVTVLANVIAFKPLPPPNRPRVKASR